MVVDDPIWHVRTFLTHDVSVLTFPVHTVHAAPRAHSTPTAGPPPWCRNPCQPASSGRPGPALPQLVL